MLSFFSIIYLTCGVLLLFLGLIIFRESSQRGINRVTASLLFFAAMGVIMRAVGILVEPQVLDNHFIKISEVFGKLFFPQLVVFSLFFPKESSIVRYKRITFLIFLPHIFHIALLLLFGSSDDIILLNSFFDQPVFTHVLQPIAILCKLVLNFFAILYDIHVSIFSLVDLIYVILAFVMMYHGYQRVSEPRIQKQIHLVFTGLLAGVGLHAVSFLFPHVASVTFSRYVQHVLSSTGLVFGLFAIAWAIIKYQFLNIRFFIGKSIILSMGSGFLVGCYLLIYNYTKQFFQRFIGFEIPILEILLLIFAAVFFQPILSALEGFIRKYFLKEIPDYQNVLKELCHDILTILDIDDLKDKILKTLSETIGVESIFLFLKTEIGVYAAYQRNAEPNPIHFGTQSEFILYLASVGDPVNRDDLCRHITNEEEIASLKMLNTQLFVPLQHRNSLEGVLCLGNKINGNTYSGEETTLFSILATQIVIALENSRLYKEGMEKQRIDEEISLAREIQRMLLPQQIPEGKSFKIAAINIPSKEVGGDYYDFVQIDERRLGIAIGDISGKGIPGSLLMSNLQATFRAAARLSKNSAEVLNFVNAQIARTTTPEKYATFFYGIFDTKTNIFHYTNAGHNFPILVRHDKSLIPLQDSDLIIGIDAGYKYNEHQLKLHPGDLLICYTDGVTEALNTDNIEFGEERFLEVILNKSWESTRQLRNQIYETVSEFASGTQQYDDMTLVIFQVR